MDDIPELEASAQERDVCCIVHKLTYADGHAYRYLISDGDRQLLYVAKRTGLLLPGQTRLTEFFDAEENPVGRLQPPDVAPWLRAKDYDIYIGEEEEPFAVIRECWRLVDILLLRLPRYEVHIGEHHYIAEGSRYDTDHFYGIFVLEGEEEPPVEEVEAAPDFLLEAGETEEKAAQSEVEAEEFEGAEILEELIDEDTEEETEPEREQVGQIGCPTGGPSYIVETDAEPLRQALLVLAALVTLIDMERHS
jgi:hypothetical protein